MHIAAYVNSYLQLSIILSQCMIRSKTLTGGYVSAITGWISM